MNYRELGKTRFEISEIGFGGWGETRDGEALKALHRAVDLGLNDTAWIHGKGRSERPGGGIVRERVEDVVVAIKIPTKNRVWPARHDVPVDECGLTGRITADTLFEPDDWRGDLYFRDDRPREVHERVRAFASDLGISEGEMAETALRYVLSRPDISTVVPGMCSVRNVELNVTVGDSRGLPEVRIRKLTAHRWVRNFYR